MGKIFWERTSWEKSFGKEHLKSEFVAKTQLLIGNLTKKLSRSKDLDLKIIEEVLEQKSPTCGKSSIIGRHFKAPTADQALYFKISIFRICNCVSSEDHHELCKMTSEAF